LSENVLKAMQRVRAVLARRPGAGIHLDEPATARWNEGLCVETFHANGTQVLTDMPVELGGAGNQASPGWLLRAALASCLATRIAMEAAALGIALRRLEVLAKSTSDARGLLGMADDGGKKITPAPLELQLEVKIGAINSTKEQLQAIVDSSLRCSPVSAAIGHTVPVGLHIDFEPN
jgi:uncharacterized OsmC-like protein